MFTLGIDAFSSRPERSGVEWYTHRLLRAMEPETPPYWRVFLYSPDEISSFNFQGSSRWQWQQLRWPPRRGWGQLRLSWEMLRRPPNILFMPSASIPLVHPHDSRRKQWAITTIHDAEFLRVPERYQLRDRRRQEFALSIAATHAARIIVPSAATRDSLHDRVGHDQAIVVPLGVDHAHYRPIADQEKIAKTLAAYKITRPYLLYVGRLDAKKNVSILIRALKLLDGDIMLVLAGSKGFGAREIAVEIEKNNLAGRVQMLGYVPEDDLPSLYCGSQAFVFPSQNEGFGLPVLQALSCGVPTVISDAPALREVVSEAALVVSKNDDVAWRDAMCRVLTDSALCDTLRLRGLARAKEFSWERTARETWRIFQDLVQLSTT